MKATGKNMPIRKTSSKGPISKGVVKPAQPKGFPVQTSPAYRTQAPPQNLRVNGLRPKPAKRK